MAFSEIGPLQTIVGPAVITLVSMPTKAKSLVEECDGDDQGFFSALPAVGYLKVATRVLGLKHADAW